MIEVRIVENSFWASLGAWKLRSSNVALTLGNSIHLHNVKKEDFLKNQKWVCHELVHVMQYQRYGKVRFIWKYIYESLRFGYHNCPMEVEARNRELETSILDNFKFV